MELMIGLLKEKVRKAYKQGFVYVNGEKKKVNGYGWFSDVVVLFDGEKKCVMKILN